jgi:hypothetical protein
MRSLFRVVAALLLLVWIASYFLVPVVDVVTESHRFPGGRIFRSAWADRGGIWLRVAEFPDIDESSEPATVQWPVLRAGSSPMDSQNGLSSFPAAYVDDAPAWLQPLGFHLWHTTLWLGESILCLPLWPLAVLVSVVLGKPLVLALRRKHRRGRNACGPCGYDLAGNVSGVCPECGHPAAAATPAP